MRKTPGSAKLHRFVLVVGHPGSGKTTFAHMLAKDVGARVVNAGDCLRKRLAGYADELTSRRKIGEVFLQHFTEKDAAEVIAEEAIAQDAMIIEGIRLRSTYELFRRKFPRSVVVSLVAPDSVRRARLQRRIARSLCLGSGSAADQPSLDGDYEADIEVLLYHAEHTVNNKGNKGYLEGQAKSISQLLRTGAHPSMRGMRATSEKVQTPDGRLLRHDRPTYKKSQGRLKESALMVEGLTATSRRHRVKMVS